MKLLHTSDWHLGQKFFHRDRKEEHQAALSWLADYIITEQIDVLIIAGDIFDTDMPPNYAIKLYYDFLKKLFNTCCKNIIVVAGNHDSANMLEAPRELLKLMNVSVVGQIPASRREQIIEILDSNTQEIKAVIGAVPYLRDRDIRKSAAGETSEERVEQLRKGIQLHYAQLADELQPYTQYNIPIITTGHLFVKGGERGDRQNTIHLGSCDVIDSSCFSDMFDYVALGHLHLPHQVGEHQHIRYAGSLIPLDFSEINYQQSVVQVTFDQKQVREIKTIPVPLVRKLRFYKGDMEYIQAKLEALESRLPLDTWLKLELETENYSPYLLEQLQDSIAKKSAEIFILNQRAIHPTDNLYEDTQLQSLSDVSELEVFKMVLQNKGQLSESETAELENTFQELLAWMQDKDKE